MLRKAVGRALALILTTGMVSACATPAQQRAQAITVNSQSAGQQLKACEAAVYNSPEVDPIRSHVPLNLNDATIEQETDSSLASDVEIKAILAEHPKTQACKQAFLTQITQTTPSLVPLFAEAWTENENSLLDLVQKKISWGDYVRTSKNRIPKFQAELAAEMQRINAGLYQENQAELAQRQAAANAFAQWVQTQEMTNALNRPVVTNCTQLGVTTNCVSQ